MELSQFLTAALTVCSSTLMGIRLDRPGAVHTFSIFALLTGIVSYCYFSGPNLNYADHSLLFLTAFVMFWVGSGIQVAVDLWQDRNGL